MAVTQSVKFGGKELADQLFDPQLGPIDYQTHRWQPFGLKGELELRGKLGGQTIIVPVRLFGTSYTNVRSSVQSIIEKQGTHEKLSIQFGGGAGFTVGEVTLDSVQETLPIRAIAFDTRANRGGYETVLVLVFRKLKQDD